MADQIYSLKSKGFKVEVSTSFDFDHSNPIQFHYLFQYNIGIHNFSSSTATLVKRHWEIFDSSGEVNVVDGEGVIGQQPKLKMGEKFKYTSFCPLKTMNGHMEGYFIMKFDDGEEFQVQTPTFYFKVPESLIDRY